ncbi:hypothetical protein ESOMN_v1c02350 [Williamsoniiplasma somnilux]|uniref:Uncharacterized protein n=1 Tax=Williamsoniiplasma somnilux TaxID=215578 RepID=A0A2K8NXR8_9MOLU|nr:hypothetical protein [Williamsoniiplasma somnilux]ATZ18619.1 hypothetical protein ESOMN_v1c02350 [Williamsoniiplasma somnilux]
MKKRFSWKYISNILFSNRDLDRVFFMLGLFLFVLSTTFYVTDWYLIVDAISENEKYVHNWFVVKGIIAFSVVSVYLGINGGFWLFIAFAPHYRIVHRKNDLKIAAMLSLNILGLLLIQYIVDNYEDPEETFSSLIMTNDAYFNKKNKLQQNWFMFFSVLTIILVPPMWFSTLLNISESKHAYLEESEIRARLAVNCFSMFSIIPPFSIVFLKISMSKPMLLSWLSEYDEDMRIKGKGSDIWHVSLNYLTWSMYWIILSGLTGTTIFLAIVLGNPGFVSKLNTKLIYILYIVLLVMMFFTLFQKYYLDFNREYPIWMSILEVITFNPILIIVSFIFVFKTNRIKNTGLKIYIKKNMDKRMVLPIAFNLIVIIITALIHYFGPILNRSELWFNYVEYDPVDILIIVLFFLSIYWFILNITKTFSYVNYLANLKTWNLIDSFSLNFIGLLINAVAQKFKFKLNEEMLWI